MSNNIYDIMAKLNSLTTEPKQKETQEETVYENVEPRGSIIEAVKSLAKKYEDFVTDENQQLDERQFSDKKTFDQLAEPGDTYKTADGGTVTKTEKGIKHSAPSGKYGAGPEDEKDELDENTSKNNLNEADYFVHATELTNYEAVVDADSEEEAEEKAREQIEADREEYQAGGDGVIPQYAEKMTESKADIRNHPIYTNEEAWDHYQKELAEQETEETVDIEDELNEISRLAGLAEKVGGNKSHDFVDDVTHKKDKNEVEEGFDPESYDKEIEYMFVGDDGEEGYGHLQYTVNVDKEQNKVMVDPKSLKATCNGDGRNKLTDEWCTEMVQPGGSEHEEALQAAQEEAEDEWESRDVDVPMDEEQLEEGPTRKDFQMVADLLKNIEDEDKKVELANHHADMFAKQNPRFDKARFLSAVGLNEEEVEEGNEFTKARLDAIKVGKDSFSVDGKTYKVSGDTSDEKQMNEDINVNVSASGEEDTLKLMMKLAGLQHIVVAKPEETPCGMEEDLEEERDIEYANTPNEKTAPVSAAVPAGTDYHKAKKSYPKTAGGDNPMALEEENLEEGLWTAYQDMIAEVKKDENA